MTTAGPGVAVEARSCPLHGVTGDPYQWDRNGSCWDCQEWHCYHLEDLRAGQDPALYEPCDCEVCERRLGRCCVCGQWAELQVGPEGLPEGISTTLVADTLLCASCAGVAGTSGGEGG